jgi:hypothetical protein
LADIQNSNEKLTFRLKKGEKEAFQELFNLYAPKIHRFTMAYLKDKSNAEELNLSKRTVENQPFRSKYFLLLEIFCILIGK